MSAERDAHWMQQALVQAELALAKGEVPVGAVLVMDDQCIASGYNQPIALHDPSAHAEMMVLRQAGVQLKNYRLSGSTLYVTLEPCAMCVGAMQHARVARCVFGASDPKTGVLGGCDDVLQRPWALHQMQVQGSVLHDPCSMILKQFFKARR